MLGRSRRPVCVELVVLPSGSWTWMGCGMLVWFVAWGSCCVCLGMVGMALEACSAGGGAFAEIEVGGFEIGFEGGPCLFLAGASAPVSAC
jgi:hypothetical protein